MKKDDTVDTDWNPVCVVTYSFGLTENSIMFEARGADYSYAEGLTVVAFQKIDLSISPTEIIGIVIFQKLCALAN